MGWWGGSSCFWLIVILLDPFLHNFVLVSQHICILYSVRNRSFNNIFFLNRERIFGWKCDFEKRSITIIFAESRSEQMGIICVSPTRRTAHRMTFAPPIHAPCHCHTFTVQRIDSISSQCTEKASQRTHSHSLFLFKFNVHKVIYYYIYASRIVKTRVLQPKKNRCRRRENPEQKPPLLSFIIVVLFIFCRFVILRHRSFWRTLSLWSLTNVKTKCVG